MRGAHIDFHHSPTRSVALLYSSGALGAARWSNVQSRSFDYAHSSALHRRNAVKETELRARALHARVHDFLIFAFTPSPVCRNSFLIIWLGVKTLGTDLHLSAFFPSEGEASLSCGEGGKECRMFTFNLSLMRRLSGWGEG